MFHRVVVGKIRRVVTGNPKSSPIAGQLLLSVFPFLILIRLLDVLSWYLLGTIVSRYIVYGKPVPSYISEYLSVIFFFNLSFFPLIPISDPLRVSPPSEHLEQQFVSLKNRWVLNMEEDK